MSTYSAMLNVNNGRFDLLEAWDGSKYFNVAAAINAVAGMPGQIADDDSRIDALEVKQGISGQ